MADAPMPAATPGAASQARLEVSKPVYTGAGSGQAGLGVGKPASAGAETGSAFVTPQASRKRPADGSPALSPSQPAPDYGKVNVDAQEIRAPMRQLLMQATVDAKLEALGKTLHGTIDMLCSVAAAFASEPSV